MLSIHAESKIFSSNKAIHAAKYKAREMWGIWEKSKIYTERTWGYLNEALAMLALRCLWEKEGGGPSVRSGR